MQHYRRLCFLRRQFNLEAKPIQPDVCRRMRYNAPRTAYKREARTALARHWRMDARAARALCAMPRGRQEGLALLSRSAR